MPLLNYSTTIDAHRTMAEIQTMLAKAGAVAIMQEYESGQVVSLSFQLPIAEGQVAGYRLPNDWRAVLAILTDARRKNTKLPRSVASETNAVNVSWRILKDWLEAQLALIEINMVKPEQVFLPYMLNAQGKTVYETFAADPRYLLGGGK